MIPSTLQNAAQRAFSATIGRGAFSVAVTGVSANADSSALALAMAGAGAAFGRRILAVRAMSRGGIATDGSAQDVAGTAVRLPDGVFLLDAATGCELHRILNDTRRLRETIDAWRGAFDAVVFDCPPFDAAEPVIYTPLTAAAAEAVLLVALPAATPRPAFDAMCKWLTESGAALDAVVLNDRFNPTLAQELARESRRLKHLAPFLPRLARHMARWDQLNRHH